MEMIWGALALGALPFLGLVLGIVARQTGANGIRPRP